MPGGDLPGKVTAIRPIEAPLTVSLSLSPREPVMQSAIIGPTLIQIIEEIRENNPGMPGIYIIGRMRGTKIKLG